MSRVHVGEVATTIEPLPADSGGAEDGGGGQAQAFEVEMEELRPLVRALVAEEMERWLRQRGECP